MGQLWAHPALRAVPPGGQGGGHGGAEGHPGGPCGGGVQGGEAPTAGKELDSKLRHFWSYSREV